MIPLLRPAIPSLSQISSIYQASEKSGMHTNFGPCFHLASKLLSENTGRPTLPVSNGTVAIQIAAAVYLTPGMTVAVPDFTCAATALGVIGARCNPVVFPCSKDSWCMDIEQLELNRYAYDAMIVVCPFGYDIDFDAYVDLAMRYNKKLIFDCAGAWGNFSKWREYPVTYSFHATKNLSIGEGGAVVFDTVSQWEKARQLTNFAFDISRGTQNILGINGKLDEIHCARIIWHLTEGKEKLTAKIQRKKDLCTRYQDIFNPGSPARHMSGNPSVCVVDGLRAENIEHYGALAGITFRRYYYPMLSSMSVFPRASFVPDPYFETCLGLPSDVNEQEFETVVKFVQGSIP